MIFPFYNNFRYCPLAGVTILPYINCFLYFLPFTKCILEEKLTHNNEENKAGIEKKWRKEIFYIALPQHFQTHLETNNCSLGWWLMMFILFMYGFLFIFVFYLFIFWWDIYWSVWSLVKMSSVIGWYLIDSSSQNPKPASNGSSIESRDPKCRWCRLMSREMVMFKYINTGTPLLLTICNQLHQRDAIDTMKMKATTVKQNYTCLINESPSAGPNAFWPLIMSIIIQIWGTHFSQYFTLLALTFYQ